MLIWMALRNIYSVKSALPELAYLTQLDRYMLFGQITVFFVMAQSAVSYALLDAGGGAVPDCDAGGSGVTKFSRWSAVAISILFILPVVDFLYRFLAPKVLHLEMIRNQSIIFDCRKFKLTMKKKVTAAAMKRRPSGAIKDPIMELHELQAKKNLWARILPWAGRET
jgi:hypothetical protein